MIPKPIDADEARRRADLSGAGFETTTDLEVLTTSIGQPRAVEALKLGVGIDTDGYNIFVLGPPASGRHALAESFLEPVAATRPTPPDWCYVHNFEDARKPQLLELPAGTGGRLRRELEKLAEELRRVLATALESDEYQTRRQIVDEEYKTLTEKLFGEVEEEARKRGLALLRTPMGVAFAPLKEDGEIAPPEEFQKLPEEERKRIQQNVEELQEQLRKSLDQAPRWERERQERLRQLNDEVVEAAIRPLIDELKSHYEGHANVLAYLDAVRQDVIEKHADILQAPPQTAAGPQRMADLALRRYHVNVLVDNGATRGAPVIYENNPTYANLVGRVEHVAREGVLTTDFTLIKAGALHRANGGYLILDARRLLQQPFAYDALKRALQAGEVRIESPARRLSLITTISLEPEPVPLDVKVVLIGEPQLYYLLTQYDPDFEKLFKVPADLDAEIDRDGVEPLYARLVATLVKERALRPFDRSAVERVIEESARMTGDAFKLSSKVEDIGDLVRESDYWAGEADAPVVDREHVERAVAARIFRLDRLRERMQEMTLRDLIYIDTDGARVGQVNGLSVISLGNFMFGRPTRISARVQMGNGRVINVEREVELSGPIHSKGVLILSAFLGARYARERPLSISASLVFEQSYSGVDGDSASSTELYALLSELAELPLKQSLAVTGSVNQHGVVQPIGGANEKIEGFFDLCNARGLTGEQGVMIPQVQRAAPDAAPRRGRGDRGGPLPRLSGGARRRGHRALDRGAGRASADADGKYPEGSVNALVLKRLEEISEKSRKFAGAGAQPAAPRVDRRTTRRRRGRRRLRRPAVRRRPCLHPVDRRRRRASARRATAARWAARRPPPSDPPPPPPTPIREWSSRLMPGETRTFARWWSRSAPPRCRARRSRRRPSSPRRCTPR